MWCHRGFFGGRFGSAALAVVSLACSAVPVSAQPTETELKPSCGGVFVLCGFVDASSGTEVIPPRFEIAQPF